MNPEQLLARVKHLTATLSTQQMVTLVGAFVGVVAIVIGSGYWMNTTTYALLFSDLDAESASAVVTKLKNAKVPYVLDEGGRTVRIAADRVDEMRLEFASQGLPTTGRIGFEIFDRTAFGTTEFLEHVNYRRALEGELARTIGTISEVASARVHIAMAKDSLFTSEQQGAKASVVLKLKTNRPLSAATVAGISGLLASSVESLRPESVVILDTFGRPLSKQPEDADDPGAGLQPDRQRRLESELSAKVVSLIEPVVGPGHVRVNVSARLTGDTEESTEEKWDPTTVIRSKQTSSDTGGTMTQAGLAGARANTPPNATTTTPPQPPVPATQLASSHTAETTNFEVSKLTRHRITPRGQVARLSVAVIVDDERVPVKGKDGVTKLTPKPRSPEALQRIQKLVASSVGVDTERGDAVTVENMSFGEATMEDPPPVTTWWTKLAPQLEPLMPMAKPVALLLMAAMAFFVVVRPIMRRALERPEAARSVEALTEGPTMPVKTVADLEREMEAQLDAAQTVDTRRLPVLTKRVSKTAQEAPEHVARLMRTWLTEEEA